MTINTNEIGRSSAPLKKRLIERIYSGQFAIGDMLPSVRSLSKKYKLSTKTVHRVLTSLTEDGYTIAIPRHGFRVQARANDPREGYPIAHVIASIAYEQISPLHQHIKSVLLGEMAKRSWPLLSVYLADSDPLEIVNQIKKARSWGMLLDTTSTELLNLVQETKMPAIMIDSWIEDAPLDSVLQDNYLKLNKTKKQTLKFV